MHCLQCRQVYGIWLFWSSPEECCHTSYFSIRKSIKTVLHLSLYLLPVFQHLPNSNEKLRKKTHSSHSVFTCVHLPDVHRAVRASHHQVVICWTPLDDLDGEEVSRCQHDALPLPETEQADGVVAGHRADAVLHPSLQRKNSRRQWSSKELQLWNIADRLVEDRLELNLITDWNHLGVAVKKCHRQFLTLVSYSV